MLGVRLGLALVLVASGAGKSVVPSRTTEAARELGIPSWAAKIVGPLLPAVEILLGILLTITATASFAAVATALLFLAFTVLIGVNLRLGRRPSCACFGTLSSNQSIGARTLARNLALLAASGLLVAGALFYPSSCPVGCFNQVGLQSIYISAAVAATGALAVSLVLGVALSRLVAQLTSRVTELEGRSAAVRVKVAAPRPVVEQYVDDLVLQIALEAVTIVHDGKAKPLTLLLDQDPASMLVLLSSHCRACDELISYIDSTLEFENFDVVGLRDSLSNRTESEGKGSSVRTWLHQDIVGTAEALAVSRFPTALLLDTHTAAGIPILVGLDEIRNEIEKRVGGTLHE